MDRMNKAQIFIALTGLRVIIGRWRLESVFIETPDMFAYGRFQMVVALYGVVLSYSLWRMFKPGSVRLPEFKESNIVQPYLSYHTQWTRPKCGALMQMITRKA